MSYTYGDSTWKDLMTSYSGQTITYDTIGNPLQYRDGMNPLRCPALSAAVNRLDNRRPQRQPLLAASATGGARRRCLEQREAADRIQQRPDFCQLRVRYQRTADEKDLQYGCRIRQHGVLLQ